jgi:hypothetical protein
MKKILITENQLKILLEEFDKDKLENEIEKFLEKNFEVSEDVQYRKLTDGRGKLIIFKYDNEYFTYNQSKKTLKNKIVSYIKDDSKIEDILKDVESDKQITILNKTVKNFIDKNIK